MLHRLFNFLRIGVCSGTSLSLCLLLSTSASVKASCGSATCPLNTSRFLTAGILHIGLSYEYIDQNRIYVGSSRSFVGALPNRHDEVETINRRTIFQAQYGLTDAWNISAELPFIVRNHSHIENGSMEYFGFNGLGDLAVSMQYAIIRQASDFDPTVSLILGIKLPTGATNETNADGTEDAEVTIQPGTGSLDWIFGSALRQNILSVPTLSGTYVTLPVTAKVSVQLNGKGKDDYRMGNVLLAHIGSEYQFFEQWSLLFQLNGKVQGQADVGSTGEFPGNTGGTYLFASPGASIRFMEGFSMYMYVQIPIYQNVNGIQQTGPYNLQFGIAGDVGLLR